jgi:hypothetical protein
MKRMILIGATALACSAHAQQWSTVGNAGTNPAVNFLGTTDNVPLVLRVNAVQSGRIDPLNRSAYFGYDVANAITLFAGTEVGQNNAAFGHRALAANSTGGWNAALGTRALESNTSGQQNTGMGMNALGRNTTGSSNTTLGAWSLQANLTGSHNLASGTLALSDNTTGTYNVALGVSALTANKGGNHGTAVGAYALARASSSTSAFTNMNVAVGYQAMYGAVSPSANTGNSNTAVGYQALAEYTSASLNTAIGRHALSNVTTASNNTGVGFAALANLVTGNNNTALGYSSGVSTSALSNSTALGYLALASASNKVRLGNSSVTVVEGQVNYTTPSDARFKQGVREDVLGLPIILKLRPVSYTFDRNSFARHVGEGMEGREAELDALSQVRTVGFLAQEVERTVEELGYSAFDAVHVPDGPTDNYGLAYAQFVVPLVRAVQELHAQNEQLLARLEALEQRVDPTPQGRSLIVYPTPARDAVSVMVDAEEVGLTGTLVVLDAQGRQVHQQALSTLPSVVSLALSPTLAAGNYQLVLRVEGRSARTGTVVVER